MTETAGSFGAAMGAVLFATEQCDALIQCIARVKACGLHAVAEELAVVQRSLCSAKASLQSCSHMLHEGFHEFLDRRDV